MGNYSLTTLAAWMVLKLWCNPHDDRTPLQVATAINDEEFGWTIMDGNVQYRSIFFSDAELEKIVKKVDELYKQYGAI